MPELPEVEVIRAGLAQAIAGSHVASLEVRDPRAVKRHRAGAADFERCVIGARFLEPLRRGKFMWIPLDGDVLDGSTALLAHLGMSGQLLLRTPEQPDDRHVRVRMWIESPGHGELRLDFADQRLFGSLAVDSLVAGVPSQVAHIARDPLDPEFRDDLFLLALRKRSAAIKKVLLDQKVISGVGNIYADEALWLARIHAETPASAVSTVKARRLLDAVRSVFEKALAEGGTSFDRLYVNVNGESGPFYIHVKRVEASRTRKDPAWQCRTVARRQRVVSRSDQARHAQ